MRLLACAFVSAYSRPLKQPIENITSSSACDTSSPSSTSNHTAGSRRRTPAASLRQFKVHSSRFTAMAWDHRSVKPAHAIEEVACEQALRDS
jgi:hypothetical protein